MAKKGVAHARARPPGPGGPLNSSGLSSTTIRRRRRKVVRNIVRNNASAGKHFGSPYQQKV